MKRDIPTMVRDAVKKRSGGLCEACGRDGANHMHHRKLRKQGGEHTLENLIHVHAVPCHHEIHAHPARSYALGLLVHSWDNPADVPVRDIAEEVA